MSINFFNNFFHRHYLSSDSYLEIKELLNLVEKKIGYPDIKTLDSATGTEVLVEGKKMLMFGSYNYLGLANNTEVKEKAKEFLTKFGIGTGGVRLLTGNMIIHEKMEKLVADFTGYHSSISIASGFGTNSGVIPAVANLLGFDKFIHARDLVIFSDEYNHASIVDGCRLSKAIVKIYRHNDISHLEQQLSRYKKYRKLIITDGVFSMDGDVARLDKIIDLAKEYGALTMVDDAHSVGILGKNGAGTAEHFDRLGQVDIKHTCFQILYHQL
ncbi:MAG: 2-amino-3-ketobutyrate coenzyme A ligase [Parcubacteria group bacterium GW2011_GWA2_36_10]|nr:MAG: 2-amino-3-ketobutyrate coenzyme A ligase [Parcubacteria group bacterium GW2011_GWA2_36_10]